MNTAMHDLIEMDIIEAVKIYHTILLQDNTSICECKSCIDITMDIKEDTLNKLSKCILLLVHLIFISLDQHYIITVEDTCIQINHMETQQLWVIHFDKVYINKYTLTELFYICNNSISNKSDTTKSSKGVFHFSEIATNIATNIIIRL